MKCLAGFLAGSACPSGSRRGSLPVLGMSAYGYERTSSASLLNVGF